MALAAAGDEVILPLPYYFNHRMWLDMLGIAAAPSALPAATAAACRIRARRRR